jgi:succinoglycan biosynthesis transport protein ExoP
VDTNERNALLRVDSHALAPRSEPVSFAEPVPVDDLRLGGSWDALRRRWRLMALTMVAVLAIGAIYTLCKKPIYESTALVMVVASPPSSSVPDNLRVLSDVTAFTRSASVESHLQLIQSPEVLRTAFLRLQSDERAKGFESSTLPKWAVSVTTAVKESDVISVMGRSYDAKAAADIANSIAATYIERDQAFNTLATRRSKDYVLSEMRLVGAQLAAEQNHLADYKRRARLVVPESQLQAITDNAASLQMEYDKASVEAAAARRQARSLASVVSTEGAEVQESKTIQMNPAYQEAMQRLDSLNAIRATLIQEYSPESKEIRRLDGEIAESKSQMKAVAATIVASNVRSRNPALSVYTGSVVSSAAADAKVGALRRVLAARNQEMDKLPARERDMARLMQKVNVLDKTHQSLSEKYYVLVVNERSILPNARLSSAAAPPPKPAVPNKPMNAAVFCLLGLMSSVCAAAVAERFDNKVRDEATVTRLTGEPIVATIPAIKGVNASRMQIGAPECDGAFAESFRNLRNVLSVSMEDYSWKLMAVTSAGRGEGKTTVSINLATAMALDGKKTLLIDCDLRRPAIRKRMDLANDNVGFTSLVNGRISAEAAVVTTNVEGLYCMPSGPLPNNPAEFLNSKASKGAIKSLLEEFDLVILDCPPSAGLSDMQVVARIVDGVILVVSLDETLQKGLYDTARRLSQVDAPMLGAVVNRAKISRSDYEYYQYSADDTNTDQETLGQLDHKDNKKKRGNA